MVMGSKVKWGRGALVSWIVAVMILLSSCGSVKNTVPSDEPNDNSESLQESSLESQENTFSDPIERLAGKYYIDGDRNTASVKIESDGSFTAYYASGTIEQQGVVRYEESVSGDRNFYVFLFYTNEGKPFMGFVDSGENKISEFETGNGDYRYIRLE